MGKIALLSPGLANQIAAGEVVERPASVVKELVENALDAGASRIHITIELGGKRIIRVEDDGEGMDPDDAELALERHATSKIAKAEDLAAIESLGFRGEALPSIASVSRLKLRTRRRGAQPATEIKVEGGALVSVKEVGAPDGTLIEVADLFYNLPARRKFLKSDAAESAQVSKLVTQLALGYHQVGFTLTSAGRVLLQCPPAGTLSERFYQLHGERSDLIELKKEAAGLQLVGYIAALAEQGPVRGPQHLFVNRRIVRDRTIMHAIVDAYSVASIKERSPEAHLFLEIAPDRVDVNVHPTKAEVRFLEQSLVHEVVRRAVAEALGQGPAPELRLESLAGRGPDGVTPALPGVLAGPSSGRWSSLSEVFARVPAAEMPFSASSTAGQVMAVDAASRDLAGKVPLMLPLGQFRDTFIIAVDPEGIAIIDQHVAHERVLFEQVMERLTAGPLESQRLLEPLIVELAPSQLQTLNAHASTLERLGFELHDFGGASLRIAAIPAIVGLEGSIAAVRALAEDLEGFDRGSRVDDALRRVAATTACHAAVKANCPLTLEKMQYILDELRRTAYSSICPHGRPVVLRLTRREIERNFQRI